VLLDDDLDRRVLVPGGHEEVLDRFDRALVLAQPQLDGLPAPGIVTLTDELNGLVGGRVPGALRIRATLVVGLERLLVLLGGGCDSARAVRRAQPELLFAAALPPLRPAAFFCAVVPPCLEFPPDPELLPPRLDAPGEFAIRAARSFDMPLSFRASYCFSFLTGIRSSVLAGGRAGPAATTATGPARRAA
jgi:hypothetical protein